MAGTTPDPEIDLLEVETGAKPIGERPTQRWGVNVPMDTVAELDGDTGTVRLEPFTLGVTVWQHLEAADTMFQNGREAAMYVLGFWRRAIRDIPPDFEAPVKLCARVKRDHLAAVLTALVQAGANASVYRDAPSDPQIEVEFSTL